MSYKILLVEDDLDLLQMLKSVAKKAGHDVLTASDLESAKNVYVEKEPDIVISDFHILKNTADELFFYMHEETSKFTPAFILITGYQLCDVMKKILEHDKTMLLQKPFMKHELEEAIKEIKK
ncbi:MAG: response regulator [Bdellovibrionales bacterium]|nr:response regulator [Bdellovibrionales bacterium]